MSYEQGIARREIEFYPDGVNVSLWFPSDVDESTRLPAIYLLDGCAIFGLTEETETPECPRVQDTLDKLTEAGLLPLSALIAVDFPKGESEAGIPLRSELLSLELSGEDFHQWLAKKLVPTVESKYPILPGIENRTIIGTGLAALNVLDLSLEETGVFSRYGCMSTSFEDVSMQIPSRCAMLLFLEDGAVPHKGARLCFDYGTEGLDECYEPYHLELNALLRQHVKTSGVEFSVLRVAGGTHDAGSWRNRLSAVLQNLFSKKI